MNSTVLNLMPDPKYLNFPPVHIEIVSGKSVPNFFDCD